MAKQVTQRIHRHALRLFDHRIIDIRCKQNLRQKREIDLIINFVWLRLRIEMSTFFSFQWKTPAKNVVQHPICGFRQHDSLIHN